MFSFIQRICLIVIILFTGTIISCKKGQKIDEGSVGIVSLAPALTRIVMQLGCGSALAGVTDSCKFNGEIERMVTAGEVVRVSGYNTINLEQIIAVQPTLIIGMDSISFESKKMLDEAFDASVVHWFYHPTRVDEIEEFVLSVSELVASREEGRVLIESVGGVLDRIDRSVQKIPPQQRKRVLVELYYPPFVTAGKNTFISDMVLRAGGILALEFEDDWPNAALEDVIASNPDILVRTHHTASDDLVKILPAAREGAVFIPADIDRFLQPGIDTVYAIEELHIFLYQKVE